FDEEEIKDYEAYLNKDVKRNDKKTVISLFSIAEQSLDFLQKEQLKNTFLLIKIKNEQCLYYIDNRGGYLGATKHLKDFTEIDKRTATEPPEIVNIVV